jgi:hypothetical protein
MGDSRLIGDAPLTPPPAPLKDCAGELEERDDDGEPASSKATRQSSDCAMFDDDPE